MRFFLLIFLIASSHAFSQITVSDNKRFLSENGKPFFWLGDTDWEMFHRLTREEAVQFINVRAEQGFNVLQVVGLAEFDGIRKPNRYGDWPLNNEDPTQLLITPGADPSNAYQYDYWDHVYFIIKTAGEKGIYIGLLPTWGDKVTPSWGDGPTIFNEKNAAIYARALAERYSGQKNIIWILGGDRPALYKSNRAQGTEKEYDDRPLWRAMATAIEGVLGKDAFITYHPSGGKYSTSQYLQEESWLDMDAFQSGHGSREADAWNWVMRDLAVAPDRPTLDMEPCYEDHPVNPWDGKWTRQRGYFTAYDVRARVYRGIFSGGCGVTYGHHQVWQFLNPSLYDPINIGDTLIGWQRASRAEAAVEMKYVKDLMLSRPFYTRAQDQTMIKSERGSANTDLIIATREDRGAYAMIYLPQNKPVKIDLDRISGTTKKAYWFDPRTGKSSPISAVKSRGVQSFVPPKEGRDWVLVIDDASKKFSPPGNP